MHTKLAASTMAIFLAMAVGCGSDATSTAANGGGTDGGARPGSGGKHPTSGGAPNGGNSGFGGTNLGGGRNGGTSGTSTSSGGAAARDGGTSGQPNTPDAAVAASYQCARDGSTLMGPTPPSVRSRVQGDNGEFVDHCDPNGNLMKYTCEVRQVCGPGPNPSCTVYETGVARATLVDCGGRCLDGICEDRCPGAGESITYQSTDGTGLFAVRNDSDGETYTCTVVFDNDRDTFDCLGGPQVGMVAKIDGGSNGTCEAGFVLDVVAQGTDAGGSSQCTLGCRRGTVVTKPPTGTPPALTACPSAGQTAPMHVEGTPDIQAQLGGTNGTFVDACTSDGNLIDRSCRLMDKSQGPPWFVYTGAVASTFYDCGGACQNGMCLSACPDSGETVTFESAGADGYLVVRNQTAGRRYGCVVSWDDPSDTFDCSSGLRAGTTGHVSSRSTSSSPCIAAIPELPVTIDGVTSCPGCPQCKLGCRITP